MMNDDKVNILNYFSTTKKKRMKIHIDDVCYLKYFIRYFNFYMFLLCKLFYRKIDQYKYFMINL
jgi:hypothetical protein